MIKIAAPLAATCFILSQIGITHAADPNSQVTYPDVQERFAYPYVEGELVWELQGDFVKKSDDPDAEITDIFGYLELATSIHLAPFFQLNSALIVEPVLDPDPGKDRFFQDHGYYVEVLNGQVNFDDNTNLVLGKFGPSFGTAWDVTPGIYGVDFAEDYELAEFIGLGFYHGFNGGSLGELVFGANTFFADTTELSDSWGHARGRTTFGDGGAGNTEQLDNFSFTLDGSEVPILPGFSWHLGYRHLSAGLGDAADERGYVAGFVQEFEFDSEQSIIFNLEYADFHNFGGAAEDRSYTTAGLTFANGPWHADLAGTLRDVRVSGGPDADDKLFQASVGYTDSNDIDWNVGYKYADEAGVESHFVGVFITSAIEFSTAQ